MDDRLISPQKVEPVELTAAKWHGMNVELTLNRPADADWVQAFYSSRSNSYQVGLEPQSYQFSGRTVTAPAREERDAQVAIDQFKRWSPEVTRIAQDTRDAQARRAEEAARAKLTREIAERERLERGNRSLTV